jgi:glycosyltransferase involved in cell wall biosynthesis
MNILFFYLGSRGGGVNDLKSILKSLPQEQVQIATINNQIAEGLFDQICGVNQVFISVPKSTLEYILYVLRFDWIKLLRVIFKIRPTHVVITMFHPINIVVFIYKLLNYRKVMVYCFLHNDSSIDVFNNFLDKIIRFLDTLYCYLADHIFVLSKGVKDYVESHGLLKSHPCTVIGFGVYHTNEVFKHDEEFFISNPISFVFFGKILPYKGLDILYKALEILEEEKYNFKCFIVGEGSLDEHFFTLPQVEVLNKWVSDSELEDILRKAHFAIFPYHHCTQSGALSTAISNALPIVVSNLPPFIETVRGNDFGYVLEKNDSNSIVNMLKYLNSQRSDLFLFHKNLLIFNETNSSWSEVCERMMRVLHGK